MAETSGRRSLGVERCRGGGRAWLYSSVDVGAVYYLAGSSQAGLGFNAVNQDRLMTQTARAKRAAAV